MITISNHHRSSLESSTMVLRARERSLQYLAQSARCTNRAEAEIELGKVREQLANIYVQLRTEQPEGPARRTVAAAEAVPVPPSPFETKSLKSAA